MFIVIGVETQVPDLNKPNDGGDDHGQVDDGVGDVDDQDCNELILDLTDQGEVEDEGDGESDQGEQAKEESNFRLRPVQSIVN